MYSCYSFLHLDFDPSLHTFFTLPKYTAVEPENKHSLKSQIKLLPEWIVEGPDPALAEVCGSFSHKSHKQMRQGGL